MNSAVSGLLSQSLVRTKSETDPSVLSDSVKKLRALQTKAELKREREKRRRKELENKTDAAKELELMKKRAWKAEKIRKKHNTLSIEETIAWKQKIEQRTRERHEREDEEYFRSKLK